MVRFARYVLRADVFDARGKCQQRRVARAADDRADDDAAPTTVPTTTPARRGRSHHSATYHDVRGHTCHGLK